MKVQSPQEEASTDGVEVLINKFCLHCKTTKTPMWRIGPSGPKSLCNACGIKFRKRGSEISKVKTVALKERKSRKKSPSDESQDRSKNGWNEGGGGKRKRSRNDMKGRLRGLGKEVVVLKRQRSASVRHQQGSMEEVEQAALLLMALSSGSVFA